MSITWNEKLSVGHDLIDDQHKELFKRYDSLIDACKSGKGKAEIRPMLDFLLEYVNRHFAEEERFMLRLSYPDREEHLRQHREFLNKVTEASAELDEKGATVSVVTSISHTTFNWLIRHVRQTDVELGRFIVGQAA
ncbi:MAG: hemerythrin [Desulfuromonas sp.]|nr:MAG: hemerythrin [Desulfuromonas sp.]